MRQSIEHTQVTEWNSGSIRTAGDCLAAEEPLEIRVAGKPFTVTMRTPGQDKELAAGLLLTEGLIEDRNQIAALRQAEVLHGPGGNLVEVDLAAGTPAPDPLGRSLFAASGCGLCGKASIQEIRRRGLRRPSTTLAVAPEVLCRLPDRLRERQKVFGRTGGLHAAALFSATGELLELREDIGRHNAVDKIIGWALLAGLVPLSRHEESYLMQKLARAVIGTNNIDNCSRYCQSPATKGLQRTVGFGADSGSIADLETAGLIIIVGSNTAENHPVLATRLKRSHKSRGQRHIVADLRRHEMAERADLFIRPNPSTDAVWINAVAKTILDQGRHRQDFIDQWVHGFDEYKKSLDPYTLEFAEKRTGVSADTLRQIADEIVKADGVCIVWAMGVTQHCGGSDTSTAISNLLLLTGNYMRHGAGGYPMRGHNNVQGTSDFGSMPNVYPGYQHVDDDEIRARFEAAWKVQLPPKPGFDNHEMISAVHEGKLKCIYLKGEDTITSEANANDVTRALSNVEFLVVQDVNFSATARFADVVLPAAPSLEKEGTFVSTERRIQRLYQVFEPLAESKPDWEIIQLIANRLGAGWDYKHPSDIMKEIASVTPIFAGVTYERLEGYKSLQWPVAEDGTDSPVLFMEKFHFPDGKAKFHPVEWVEPCEHVSEEFALHLNNGRLLEHFQQGAMTYRSAGISRMAPTNFVEVSPELARERNIDSGARVTLRSPDGEVTVPVVVTDRVYGTQLYMPMNSTENPVNRLTSSQADRAVNTPAYKEVSVSLTPVSGGLAPNPLPPENFRHGHRTPQDGVEVERKWSRPDYQLPGTHPADKRVQFQTTHK